MTGWTVARVAGPGSIGLALVVARPSWVSVAVLGLLLVVAMWFDGQERRADDVEALEEQVNSRLTEQARQIQALEVAASANAEALLKTTVKVSELGQRLDATAQQRKGPSL